jgi:NAD(P)-dependent dehydrogenase (short-subunit alcohol dehydrogenase family)
VERHRPLRGRTALVTGGSSGIGRAIGERLALDGASVHLVGRTAAAMDQTVAAIRDDGGVARSVVLDVRDSEALEALIDRVADEEGLDVMVNAAGLEHGGPILDGEIAEWRELLDVNLLAVLVGSRAAVRAMRRTDCAGHIVNISSPRSARARGSTAPRRSR